MRRRGDLGRTVAALVVVMVSLAGCSSDGDVDEAPESLTQYADQARSRGFDWQADLLSDGDITLAEYDEGSRRNLACLDAGGISYAEPVRSILDGYRWDYEMRWEGVAEDVGMQVASDCTDENLAYLEVAMGVWGDWQTEPAVLADIEQCVSDRGFEVDVSAQNYREVWLSAADQGLTTDQVADCGIVAMERLHPGVAYAIGF